MNETKEIDIYDFDMTVVPFDSGSFFAVWCLPHYPWIIICLPVIIVAALLAVLHIINFTGFKKVVFCFVPLIPLNKAVKKFWDKYEGRVNPWFRNRKRESVIISASPDFLLNEIAARLGVEHLLCTRHNPKTGAIVGLNCRDDEKVRRFNEECGGYVVKDVYSDSLKHDKNIFELATGTCYQIIKREPVAFNFSEKYGQ